MGHGEGQQAPQKLFPVSAQRTLQAYGLWAVPHGLRLKEPLLRAQDSTLCTLLVGPLKNLLVMLPVLLDGTSSYRIFKILWFLP